MDAPTVIAFSGGVGGAKLAHGLARHLADDALAVVCNTGDDFEHLGLTICPDLDTVMYTLAGRSHPQQGWGLAGESWRTMGALEALGADSWFRLGDLDLATHLFRLQRLRAGATLTQVTNALCAALGVRHRIWPMSDEPVRTMVETAGGTLPFQHYFVRDQCRPVVTGFHFDGIGAARPQADLLHALADARLRVVVVCPSNPFVSIDPILHLSGLRAMLAATSVPVVAVSPIVGGQAIKGPAAKMMRELGLEVTARAVAAYYRDFLDGFVIDRADAHDAAAIEALGMQVLVTNTVMTNDGERATLAAQVLAFSTQLAGRR